MPALRRTAAVKASSKRPANPSRRSKSGDLLLAQNMVLERIAANAPLHDTLNLLLGLIDSLAPPVMSSILLLDDDGIHVRHAAAPHLPFAYTQAIDGEAIGDGIGSCGTAAYRKEAVVTDDIETDPRWDRYRDLARQFGLRACWSTPIFDEQQRVLGTFALYWRKPGRPSKWHMKLIENATRAAAIAISRNRENEALARSEERLRLAVKGASIGIWEWDAAADRFHLSDELTGMLGLPAEQWTNVSMHDVLARIHPEDRERVHSALLRALADGGEYRDEFRVMSGDFSFRWINSLGCSSKGTGIGPVHMHGVAIDTTQRRRAEEDLKRREAQLAAAQRLAHFGSYEWDLASGLVSRSEELYRIFGLNPAEFVPTLQGYIDRVHPDDRAMTSKILEEAYAAAKPFSFEERIIRPDGEIRVLHSRGRWECDAEGHPIRLVGTCQDITESRRAAEQLQAANTALQALSRRLINAQEEERTRIARELHDDFSQQIATASLAVSGLKKSIPATDTNLRAQTESIQKKLIGLAAAARQLSHQLHPSILEHSGLLPALERSCAELRDLKGLRISVRATGSFDDVPSPVALTIYRVAQEALQNVVKHADVDDATLSLIRANGTVTLTISDRGRGIDAQKDDPDGLGLISMRERARLVNATLDIQSEPDTGTTVTLIVPETWTNAKKAAATDS